MDYKISAQVTDTLLCDKPDRDTIEFENLPWFGNNAYLENFLDSINYPSNLMMKVDINKISEGKLNSSGTVGINGIVGSERIRFHIPIKFWVYRNSSGIGGPSLKDLQNYIDNLNKYYNVDNNTLIGFYMRCEIGYIDDDNHLDINYDNEANSLLQNHKERGCINIHIVNSLQGNTIGIQIRARFFGIDGIFLDQSTYTRPEYYSTIAHEVGHYLELDHTHQYFDKGKCRKEPIDRTRTYPFIRFCPFSRVATSNIICESAGDGLSDTQADPNLTNNFSCDYLLGGNDPWGDSYANPPHGISEKPNTHNIMSYNGQRTCVDVFSRLQIAVMLYSIYRGKSSSNRAAWSDLRAEYDDYEMDNFSTTARPITSNEVQVHNFNQQYYGDGIWGQCDVDWVRFIPSCSQSFAIQTSAIPGKTDANTKLTIYDNSLNQLAQNDDISASNHYSKIILSLTASQPYFIKVENMSTNVTGYYNLNITPAFVINGDNNFCTTSNNYTISNLPTGATVLWSVAPTGIVTVNTSNSTQTTLSKIYNGTITLQAIISNVCGGQITLTKPNIAVGVPTITSISSSMTGSCNGLYQEWSLSAVANSPVSSWQWTVDNPANKNWIIYSPNSSSTIVAVTGGGGITVHATNVCGTGTNGVTIWSNCHYGPITASPNPTTNNVMISIDQPDVAANSKATKAMIYNIKVIDQMGNLKKEYNYRSGVNNTQISLSGYTSGMYTIQAFDGTNWNSVKVIKQ